MQALLQAMPAAAGAVGGRQIVGTASDASFQPQTGHRAWALATDGDVLYDNLTDDERALPSDVLELLPLAAVMEQRAAQWRGRLVVFATDNLVNMYRVNRGRAAAGGAALAVIQRLYAVADAYDIDFVAIWLPRAANQLLDALSKCSDGAAAEQLAQAAGLRLSRWVAGQQ